MANIIQVPGTFDAVAAGKKLADASQIYDGNTKQSEINNSLDEAVKTKYEKPNTGIPKTDLSSFVQASLNKADTAIQTHQDISGKADKSTTYTKTEVDAAIAAVDVSEQLADYATKVYVTNTVATKANTADVNTALNNKQDTIQDLSDIRSGAALGATAKQPATTIAGYGITDAYTKTEVNELVSTPHQNYVTVATKADLDAIVDPSTDTIYRVSSYDFTANAGAGAVDVTKYSEYAYNGTAMIPLTVKSQINEIFDISEYHSGTTYSNLTEALGVDGANVPLDARKGGMSVRFVQSSDHKYVQYRYMLSSTTNANFTNVANWQGVDDEPKPDSRNLIESGGVMKAIAYEVGIETLFDTYSRYDTNDGEIENDEQTQYHASQKINIGRGGVSQIRCSIPYNVMMFWDANGTYLGSNQTGDVPSGASVFVVGFNNTKPFSSGASVIIGGLKQDSINYTDDQSLLDNSLIGFNLTQNIEVASGQASGNNKAFPAGSLALNDTIYFCLVDNNHCVDKYGIPTQNGQHIVPESGFYIYSPNVVYKKTVTYSDIASKQWGCYITSANCIGNGIVKFFCSKDTALIKYLVSHDEVDVIEDRLEIDELNIGFSVLYQTYHEYSVNSGRLEPGTQSDNYVASQKIYLQEGQTKVKCSFNPNAYLFYGSDDSYIGWNQTGNVLSGSAYVVIGLGYQQGFDDTMLYYIPNESSIVSRVSALEANSGQSFWHGKTFAVLGDSLSVTGDWENKFAELAGATYISGYSKGGEATISTSGDCEMDRARQLLSEHPEVNAIFIQNINDMNLYGGDGQITDLPYMMTQNVLSETTYGTQEQAQQAIASEIAAIANHLVGTMLRIPYGTAAKKVTIGNAPSANGTITITIGTTDYAVTVNSAMSIQDVQEAILAYDYGGMGYSDTASSTNAVLFTDTENRGSSAPAISVDAGTTGITLTITDSTSVSYVTRCFMSKDVTEWSDTSKWHSINSITRYQLYKGLISWLQTNFPNAYIFMLGLPRYSWTDGASTYKYADGTYDWDNYRSNTAIQYIFDCQKAVADYMRIPYVDVVNNCAISIFNASTFYPKGDVHPKTVGYERWGETVARLLK